MLIEFLSLYLRDKIDKIVVYSILVLILFLWLFPFDILQSIAFYFYIIFAIFIILLFSFFILRRIKRTCIIFDSKLNREAFSKETGGKLLKKKKLSKSYMNWLIKKAKNQNLDFSFKPNTPYYSSSCCYYLCYCTFPMILIFGVITLVFIPPMYEWFIPPLIIILTMLIFFFMQRNSNNEVYKNLHSEIKKIIFEEETGYKPIKRGKFTYKYKAWLILNEKRDRKPDVFI